VIAVAALVRYRREVLPTLSAPFGGRAKRHGGHPHPQPEPIKAS
jgi:cation:H+ antiporter